LFKKCFRYAISIFTVPIFFVSEKNDTSAPVQALYIGKNTKIVLYEFWYHRNEGITKSRLPDSIYRGFHFYPLNKSAAVATVLEALGI